MQMALKTPCSGFNHCITWQAWQLFPLPSTHSSTTVRPDSDLCGEPPLVGGLGRRVVDDARTAWLAEVAIDGLADDGGCSCCLPPLPLGQRGGGLRGQFQCRIVAHIILGKPFAHSSPPLLVVCSSPPNLSINIHLPIIARQTGYNLCALNQRLNL